MDILNISIMADVNDSDFNTKDKVYYFFKILNNYGNTNFRLKINLLSCLKNEHTFEQFLGSKTSDSCDDCSSNGSEVSIPIPQV